MNRLLLLLLSVFALQLTAKTTPLIPVPPPHEILTDTVPPVIVCPASFAVFIPPSGPCDTVVTYQVTATDDQGQAIVIQLAGLSSGSVFPLGVTNNSFIATDLASNTSSCAFSITVIDQTPTALVCDDLFTVTLGPTCTRSLSVNDVLIGAPFECPSRYVVEVDKVIPFGNGPWLPADFMVTDINNTYQYRVTDTRTSNNCWGNVAIKDVTGPVINCPDVTLVCAETRTSPDYIRDSLGIAAGFPTFTDACGPINSPTYVDIGTQTNNCDSLYDKVITRRWQAVDGVGNTSICLQKINLRHLGIPALQLPPDVTLNCPGYDTDPNLTGYPFVMDNGKRYNMTNGALCDLSAFFQDFPLALPCGDLQVRRIWEYFDFCTGETTGPFVQNLYILDKSKPTVACPPPMQVTLSVDTCYALFDLPDVVLNDPCSQIANFQAFWTDNGLSKTLLGSLSDFVGNDPASFDTLGVLGTALLPVGVTEITLVAEDSCGNIGDCIFQVSIADMTPPTARCDTVSTLNLSDIGTLVVPASIFDNGSTDDCGPLFFKVRLLDSNACQAQTIWGDSLYFCCQNIGDTLNAVLRVYDILVTQGIVPDTFGQGQYSDCALKIFINDPHPPLCVPPPSVTVNCQDFDPTLAAYGNLTAVSCSVDSMLVDLDYSQFDSSCARGVITRHFRVFDQSGNSGSCTQVITAEYRQEYFIRFPDDVIVTSCNGTGLYGEPQFLLKGCEDMVVTYTDEMFTVVPDACFKIERLWKIVNKCNYDSLGSLITVPNPSPSSTTNSILNLPGPIVSACGTSGVWAPTQVRINPANPSPTNFCTFYDADGNGYTYKQTIKIIDDQEPTGTFSVPECSNQTWTTDNNPLFWNETFWFDPELETNNLCEEPVDLSITVTDACSGANVNVEYLLYLDLNQDGIKETVINSTRLGITGLGWNNVQYDNLNTPNFLGGTPREFDDRPVSGNQKVGFARQKVVNGNTATYSVAWNTQQIPNGFVKPELPHGTHRIKWFVTDLCGNEKQYQYDFTVTDCKAPSVACLDLNINAGSTVFFGDFIQVITDNCAPNNKISTSMRRCGTGTGFPTDANGAPISTMAFSCDTLGPQCVELWAKDHKGNADFCASTITVSDNNGICDVVNNANGRIATELGVGVDSVSVGMKNSLPLVPPFTSFDPVLSNNAGNYLIPASAGLPNHFSVFPELEKEPLNGVTTFDLVLISKHILGTDPLVSPYKIIAADANRSGSVTTFDMVELRKLILGIYLKLPANTSWRFVDSAYVFPNLLNPFQGGIPDSIPVDQTKPFNFVGIKVGDLNHTAVPNAQSPATERFVGLQYFDTPDARLEVGDVWVQTFESAEALEGCQFTLDLDGLELLEIVPGPEMGQEHFAVFPEQKRLTMAWEKAGQATFSLKLRALQAGAIHDMLRISDQITPAEAYIKHPVQASELPIKSRIALRFDGKNASFELFQNQPNPFEHKTNIAFYLPNAGPATLSVLDGTGRVLWRQQDEYAAGHHTQTLDLSSVSGAGVLYYQLESSTHQAVRKMVRIGQR